MAGLTIQTTFAAINKFTPTVKMMGNSVSKFAVKTELALARGERAFRRLGAPIRRLNSQLGGFGAAIGGVLVLRAVGNAINIFKDFEQANANLASVMATATGPQLQALSNDAIRLGSTTAKSATEVVGLQESFARLGFVAPDIVNMTEATIAGSIAMNAELSETANLVGAMVRTFDDFSSIDAPMIMDQMVAATQQSALSFEKLNTALPIVSGAANAAGIPFTKLMSLLGKLSDAGIDASSSSTALRNIFIESAKQGLSFEQILQKIEKSQDKLTAANDEFGKRGAISAVILAKNLSGVEALDKALQGAAGTAEEAAKKQLNTLNGALTILSSSYEGFILNMEKGNPAFAKSLKTIVQTASEVLALATGTANYVTAMDDAQARVRTLAEKTIFWVKVIGWVVAGLIAFKVGLIALGFILGAYNIAIGISAAVTGVASIAVGQSTIALGAYKGALFLVTAAQWLWNGALAIGLWPLTLIAIGIAATIALITVIVKKWDDWGAAITLFLGPLGLVISLVQSFRNNWEMITKAFKTEGMIAGIKAIGITIFDVILLPLQQVLELIGKIPGLGFASDAASSLEGFRQGLGLDQKSGESDTPSPLINPELDRQERFERTLIETKQAQDITLTVNDPKGNVDVDPGVGPAVVTTNTFIPVPQ